MSKGYTLALTLENIE